MNSAEVLRRLWKEKHEWESNEHSREMEWTLRGINLCITHVKDILREQREHDLLRRPRIHRWIASDLFHAIEVALKYLANADKRRAMSVLAKAKETAQQRTKGV